MQQNSLPHYSVHLLAGTAQSGMKLTIGWMAWGSNPGGGEIFHACSDWPWGSPTLLYNGYWVSFLEAKQLRKGADHPPPSSAEVKEREE